MEKRNCKQCGKEFELSNGEIKFYKEKAFSLPKRCEECRGKNKKVKEIYIPVKHGNRNNIYMTVIVVFIILMALKYKLSSLNYSAPNNNFVATYESESVNPRNYVEDTVQKSEFQMSNESSDTTEESIDQGRSNENTYVFRSQQLRDDHFARHGTDFNYLTADEYEAGASRVVNSSEVLHKTEKEDGDDVYYIKSTNEFVIVSTVGYLRTYFKPEDGIEYYDRQ